MLFFNQVISSDVELTHFYNCMFPFKSRVRNGIKYFCLYYWVNAYLEEGRVGCGSWDC